LEEFFGDFEKYGKALNLEYLEFLQTPLYGKALTLQRNPISSLVSKTLFWNSKFSLQKI